MSNINRDLTVQNQKASAPELNLAAALNFYSGTLIDDYIFQYYVSTSHTLPGEGNTVDFIVLSHGVWYAEEVDGEIAHKTVGQKEYDRQRDIFVGDVLKNRGFAPAPNGGYVHRIDAAVKLPTIPAAKEYVLERFR